MVHCASLFGDLSTKSSDAARRLLGDDGALQLLRLRTKNNEILIAPNEEATLVVMQKAHSAAMVPLVATEGAAPSAAAPTGTEEKKADK